MNTNCSDKQTSVLNKIPDSILIIPVILALIYAIISGEIFNLITFLFCLPIILIIITYIQRNIEGKLNDFGLYAIRRIVFSLILLLMLFGAFGMSIGIASGERLLPTQPLFIEILLVIGYIFNVLLLYRYASYVKTCQSTKSSGKV